MAVSVESEEIILLAEFVEVRVAVGKMDELVGVMREGREGTVEKVV